MVHLYGNQLKLQADVVVRSENPAEYFCDIGLYYAGNQIIFVPKTSAGNNAEATIETLVQMRASIEEGINLIQERLNAQATKES